MKKIIILCIGIYIFSACGNTESKNSHTNNNVYNTFIEHKKQWDNRQTQNYSFVVKKTCFCPYEEKIQVTVENNLVIEAKYIPSNSVIDNGMKQKNIDGYFDMIQEALDNNVYQLTVQYDETYGYPKEIYIDYDEQMVDEEVSYTLTDFNTYD